MSIDRPTLEDAAGDSFLLEYMKLPAGVKLAYSFVEYKSMTDHQRSTIVDDEVEPEWEEF